MVETLNNSDVERALVITAHPDDIDFGAAGTIASWTEQGISVSYCICTNGDAGGFDPTVPRHEIPLIRQHEQRAAAKAVGVNDVHFLGYTDGALEPTLDLRRDISRVIRQVRPQRVVCQNPERAWDFSLHSTYTNHPDHLAAGEAALRAVYPDSRNPFAFPELLREGHEEWVIDEVWVMTTDSPNHSVDITNTFDKKLAALCAHESQVSHIDPEAMLRRIADHSCELMKVDKGQLIEVFRVLPTS